VLSVGEGTVHLDRVTIKVAEKQTKETSIGLLSHGGVISFRNGKFEAPNAIALWVSGDFDGNAFKLDEKVEEGVSDEIQRQDVNADRDRQASEVNDVVGEVVPIGEGSICADYNIYHTTHSTHIEVLSSIEGILNSGGSSRNTDVPSRDGGRDSEGEQDTGSEVANLIVSDIQNSTIKLKGNSYGVLFEGGTYQSVEKRNDQNGGQDLVEQNGAQNLV
ncbi:hypothetical protein, partial [Bartonella sp. AP58NXGY]|uniref:hypothetical protein n=1 Tax=Bartonella sp. AP58NXGY TaxID=3243498 RepID=UPI0035CF0231